MKFFILMFLTIGILGHLYLSIRVYQAFEGWPSIRIPSVCFVIFVFLLCMVDRMHLINGFSFQFTQTFELIVSVWIFCFVVLLFSFGIADLFRLINYIFHIYPSFIKTNYISIKCYLMLATIVITSFLSILGYFNFLRPVKTELDLFINKRLDITRTAPSSTSTPASATNTPVDDKSAALNIVAVSDLHLGYTIHKNKLREYVDSINAQDPDIVLIIGDLIDGNIEPVLEQRMHEELSQIKSRYGVYVALGNHERISRRQEKIVEYYKKAGLIVLMDSVALVDNRFYVVGRKDRSTSDRKETAELVAGLDKSKPIILLDHQPYNLEHSEAAGVDLHLSGHTHDGQFFPISLITRAVYEVSAGYKLKTNTHVYVTSGLGLWGPPIRLGTKSEFVVIHLRGNSEL